MLNDLIKEVESMADILLETACLPLYSESNAEGKFVPLRNSLNMWNASGRRRHENEIGIPIPIEFRNRHSDFFPGNSQSFDLRLPNFRTLKAKQCQQDGKALMSNPNKDLGEWLLRTVLQIKEGTVVTYNMLLNKQIDSVYLEKWFDGQKIYYKIFPAPVGEYDKYIRGAKVTRKGSPDPSTVIPKEVATVTAKPQTDYIVKPVQPTLKKGSIIQHPKYGKGIVISVKDTIANVKFGSETKSLSCKWLIEHNTII